MNPDNLEAGKIFGARNVFKVCTGACYLGGYIGDEKFKGEWLKGCTDKWERNIHAVTKTVGKYPKKIYAVVINAIQPEWVFFSTCEKNRDKCLWEWKEFCENFFASYLFGK